MNLRVKERLVKIRDWLTTRFGNAQAWIKGPTTQSWLKGIGTSAFLAFMGALFIDVPLPWIILTAGITLICICLTFERSWETIKNLVLTISNLIWNSKYFILTIVAVATAVAIIVYVYMQPEAPEFPERQFVADIQNLSSKSDTEKWTVVKEESEPLKKILSIRNYELIETTDSKDMVKKIYIKDGKKIAEDDRGPDPYTYSRKYYRSNCNFAIDYLDGSLRCVSTEYRKDCKADFKRFDCYSNLLFPLPPVPVFTYH